MESFLKYVAQDIVNDYIKDGNGDLSQVAVVFPNKRASLFLNEELMAIIDRPFWCPTYITISDLFRRHSKLQVADPIKLICDLYKTFVECTGVSETLDHFYGWGQLLLADFDDIDKNMADARQIFTNLENLHELDDDSYLTEEQRKILNKFFANFKDAPQTELKERFKKLWNHLAEIYAKFNERLASHGLAYEGALYRQVAENKDIQFDHTTYLFVGFNMMQRVELQLYDQLRTKAECHFYWDYDSYYVDDKKSKKPLDRTEWILKNEAGHYVSLYLADYGNKLANRTDHEQIYDNMSRHKDLTYISAPTENIQARYVRDWLLEDRRYEAGSKTAIVLADESLLQTVIHSLPEEVKDHINITIGYPLQQTPFFSLVQHLMRLQTIGHNKNNDTYRLSCINKVLKHPYAKFISASYDVLREDLESKKFFHPTRERLSRDEDEGLRLLFSNLDAAENFNLALADYLVKLLKLIGTNARDHRDPLFQESLYRSYTLVNRLRGLVEAGDLVVDTITFERLVQQLFQATSIPFHGEPAIGVQIMGVLETRNLDFEHILVLSCNEGNLPKGVNDSSFIPYSIRKAYGLTTIDNKVAIFAYYFLRMIQRAKDVTLTYNNATEDGHSGEMSRFMLQLMVESPHHIEHCSLTAGQNPQHPSYVPTPKDEKAMGILNGMKFVTPTFLSTYLRCPKRFCYKYIQRLEEPEELEEEIDNRIFGNIFHRAAQLFYLKMARPGELAADEKTGEPYLTKELCVMKGDIERYAKDEKYITGIVDEAFREELFKVDGKSYHPDYNGLQLINREVIVSYLRQLLKIDQELAPFYIKGLEIKVSREFAFDTPDGKKTLLLGGFIDRLDSVSSNGGADLSNMAERIRVIDYKTGRTPTSLPREVSVIFDPAELGKHTDYYLQAMLYSIIVKHDQERLNPGNDPVSPALLFIQQSGAKGYDPTLKFGKDVIYDAAAYEEEFMEGLRGLVAEIFDPATAFCPTEDRQRCTTCPYAELCKYSL